MLRAPPGAGVCGLDARAGLDADQGPAPAAPVVASARPRGASGPCPEEVRSQVTRPPDFEHLTPEAFVARFDSALNAREQANRAEMKVAGRKFMGIARVMDQRCDASPNTPDERGERKTHAACKDKEQRIAALERLTTWRQRYRDAWKRRRAGEEGVISPYGTYLHARVPGGRVERPPGNARAAA
jgi:hypothetical protein